MVIPAAASVEWYSRWLRRRLEGLPDHEACDAACADLHTDPKSLRRYSLPDAGQPGKVVTLSIPVRKGTGLLSDHGNWPRVHLGTLNALYGRKPYFTFVSDAINPIFADAGTEMSGCGILSLAEFNLRLHRAIAQWIDLDAARMALNGNLTEVCREFATKVNCSLSILDPVSRFGKDIVFVLLNGYEN